MDRCCKICGKTRDLFTLDFEKEDTDAEEEFSVFVCGSCWDIIGTIAKRVVNRILENQLMELSK